MTRLALLSVSDKTGIIDLAQQLIHQFDFELISSGGTAKALQAAGLPVTKVSEYTGSPEILGGRVKTLHPRIHGGILGRRDLPQDTQDMETHQIHPIDLVVVNLYPFEQTIANPNVTVAEAIENIDIGGPTLLRAAAKNYAHVTVLSNPKYYDTYLQELAENNGEVSLEFRQKMAGETFALTNSYDGAIANYFMTLSSENESTLPSRFTVSGTQFQSLRYGENPHQQAAWYQTGTQPSGWAAATQLQGKELSYNNLVDLEAARRIIAEFNPQEPAVAILKHTNPCGVAVGNTLADAYEKAFNADSISAFGGIIALNQPLDKETASLLTKTFLECVVAPGCDDEAKEILTAKSKVRVLVLPDLMNGPKQTIKVIAGGLLVQASDDVIDTPDSWKIVTEKQPTLQQLAELLFAWKVAKHVKSNAIVVTKNRTTLGIGAGQMNRVGSVKIALEQAGEAAMGGCLASDGFFPFDDSVRTAAAAGIKVIVQPGGSVKDKDSIAAANELGLVMMLTGIRHFLH
ncbi:phosphoribosylaminoimidazolecarboxamide formyltransferase/IMP cyclohydrolase [Rippkaea orientalis PCC 8801]|uniref:Bifunctional purine biosynthesis protein PurH n=1 Tax=Rippkaea orientalis (strain PCC 8801 / RF-1) TaxID=41431 RepID=PUR9_RIPO1|nr:bifunctional phosphoribosylaminoimidazolecarboxamide formyltransferase/IMP cyclohydrolase [Rippkaea orientalis]B7K3N8.1 RecName: Full=Bifunctional purine biosynthesis protein PurH; Includes: RecName: Full=Phosphoribosylaminoimidazolecarboxamide formyltransferase; AltName: Full=AICAR transformylase; Includes: RecName: Full=IMP cyclohydrolase; AltName: Full=ATIC; AltName: Full=IMP synthase; AltName: Full=Inosinicase [Rippkaea orientalis PCC 8801]ACK65380.1 phosphoribosylaminoimidazolecarboxamide